MQQLNNKMCGMYSKDRMWRQRNLTNFLWVNLIEFHTVYISSKFKAKEYDQQTTKPKALYGCDFLAVQMYNHHCK